MNFYRFSTEGNDQANFFDTTVDLRLTLGLVLEAIKQTLINTAECH